MGKEQNKRMMEYVMDQMSDLPGVRQIPMMGGYIFYYNERIFDLHTRKSILRD